jgi:hypothetical protein
MKTLSDTAEDICGNQFNFESGGCTIHKRVHGWNRNGIYVKKKRDQSILWRDVLWPHEIQTLENQHLEEMEADRKAVENQEILAEADAEGRYAYERFNERKRASDRRNQTLETISEAVELTAKELRRIKLEEKFAKGKVASRSVEHDSVVSGKTNTSSSANGKERSKGKKKR